MKPKKLTAASVRAKVSRVIICFECSECLDFSAMCPLGQIKDKLNVMGWRVLDDSVYCPECLSQNQDDRR